MQRAEEAMLFVTGTRADFGKLKPLIARGQAVARHSSTRSSPPACTCSPAMARRCTRSAKAGFDQVFPFINQDQADGSQMDLVLANTMQGLVALLARVSRRISSSSTAIGSRRWPGAIVGALNNVLVAHVEGGELSGTVDELIAPRGHQALAPPLRRQRRGHAGA